MKHILSMAAVLQSLRPLSKVLMKKQFRLLWFILCAYLIAAGGVLPFTLYYGLPYLAKKKLHAQCTLKSVYCNPFTLTLYLNQLSLSRSQDQEPLFKARRIKLNHGLSSLFALAPALNALTLIQPELKISIDPDGENSWQGFFPKQPEKTQNGPTKLTPFVIRNFHILDGSIAVNDQKHHSQHLLQHINVYIPFSSTRKNDLGGKITPHINATLDGAALDAAGWLSPFAQTREAGIDLSLQSIAMDRYQPYLSLFTPLTVKNGQLDAELHLSFSSQNEQPELNLSGTACLKKLQIDAPGQEHVFSLDEGTLKIQNIALQKASFAFNEIALKNPVLLMKRNAAGEYNFNSFLFPPQQKKQLPPPQPEHKDSTPVEKDTPQNSLHSNEIKHNGNANYLPVNSTQTQANAPFLLKKQETAPNTETQALLQNSTASGNKTSFKAHGIPTSRQNSGNPVHFSFKHASIHNGSLLWMDASTSAPVSLEINPIHFEARDIDTHLAEPGAFLLAIGPNTPDQEQRTELFSHFEQTPEQRFPPLHNATGGKQNPSPKPLLEQILAADKQTPISTGEGGQANRNDHNPTPCDAVLLQGTISFSPFLAQWHTEIKNLRLPAFAPYISAAGAELSSGVLTMRSDCSAVTGQEQELIKADGETLVENLEFSMRTQTEYLTSSIKQLYLNGIAFDTKKRLLSLTELLLRQPACQITLEATGAAEKNNRGKGGSSSINEAKKIKEKYLDPSTLKQEKQAVTLPDRNEKKEPGLNFLAVQTRISDGRLQISKGSTGHLVAEAAKIEFSAANLSSLTQQKSAFSMTADCNQQGKLKLQGGGSLSPLKAELRLQIDGLPLGPLFTLMEPEANLLWKEGSLFCDGTVYLDGKTPPPPHGFEEKNINSPAWKAKGRASLRQLKINKGAKELCSLKEAQVSGILFDSATARYQIEAIDLKQPRIILSRHPDGSTTFDELAPKTKSHGQNQGKNITRSRAMTTESLVRLAASKNIEPEHKKTTKKSIAQAHPKSFFPDQELLLKNISISDGQILLEDQMLSRQNNLAINKINARISSFSSQRPAAAQFVINASVADAPLQIQGATNPFFNPLAGEATFSLKQMNLKPLSAYAEYYLACPIFQGQLSIDGDVKIDQTLLTAKNTVKLIKLRLGPQLSGKEAPDYPIKTGLALLEDSRGVVSLSVPISGRLNDPEFKVNNIFAQLFGNTIFKILSSPFSLIGSAFSSQSDTLPAPQSIIFAAGSSTLDAQAATEIAALSDLLNKKTKLFLLLTGTAGTEEQEALLDTLLQERIIQNANRTAQDKAQSAGVKNPPVLSEQAYAKYLAQLHSSLTATRPSDQQSMKLSVERMREQVKTVLAQQNGLLEKLAMDRARQVREAIVTREPTLAPRVLINPSPLLEETEAVKTCGGRTDISFQEQKN